MHAEKVGIARAHGVAHWNVSWCTVSIRSIIVVIVAIMWVIVVRVVVHSAIKSIRKIANDFLPSVVMHRSTVIVVVLRCITIIRVVICIL
jgi:hypothetical protein